jgi:MraZ protein
MRNFLGQYEYVMDEKGRVNIPSRFRDLFVQDGLCTVCAVKGNDGCINVFSPRGLEQYLAGFEGAQFKSERDARRFQRLLAQGGSVSQPDQQGRITLSEELRRHAGLTRDVVMYGNLDRMEIWDPERLRRHLAAEDQEVDQLDDLASKYLK